MTLVVNRTKHNFMGPLGWLQSGQTAAVAAAAATAAMQQQCKHEHSVGWAGSSASCLGPPRASAPFRQTPLQNFSRACLSVWSATCLNSFKICVMVVRCIGTLQVFLTISILMGEGMYMVLRVLVSCEFISQL
jgi:hypothetical protein